MSLIQINNVSKFYGSKKVLSNVNLEIGSGKIVGLLGPNGSGKTTMIKILNGLIPYSSGSVSIDGKRIGVETKKIISYLPERTYLNMNFSSDDYIKFFADFYEDFDTDKAYKFLETLAIDPSAKLKTLSKGTKEKVQLILTMSRKAKLFILDEPIAGVDPASRDFIIETILKNFEDDATLLICTHLISDIETILDEVVFINDGQIFLHDSADDLRNKYNGAIDKVFREVFSCYSK